MTTFGLIPAAGKSSRMGRPKLLLPLGKSTVLERVLLAVRGGGIADCVVVSAPHDRELARLAAAAGGHVAVLPADTPDMRATVMHGLAWIERQFRPARHDGWLLLPADHPTVRLELVRAVLAVASDSPGLVVPVHQGRRGHPTWFRWSLAQELADLPAGLGLNAFIRARPDAVRELPWPDADIVHDLDTPADYQTLAAAMNLSPEPDA